MPENSADVSLTGALRATIYSRIKDIARAREGLASQIANLNNEEARLIADLKEIETPAHKPRKPRLCNVCKKPTQEWFGGIPQCARHHRAGVTDAQASRI